LISTLIPTGTAHTIPSLPLEKLSRMLFAQTKAFADGDTRTGQNRLEDLSGIDIRIRITVTKVRWLSVLIR
jgi:hypothetical protein